MIDLINNYKSKITFTTKEQRIISALLENDWASDDSTVYQIYTEYLIWVTPYINKYFGIENAVKFLLENDVKIDYSKTYMENYLDTCKFLIDLDLF